MRLTRRQPRMMITFAPTVSKILLLATTTTTTTRAWILPTASSRSCRLGFTSLRQQQQQPNKQEAAATTATAQGKSKHDQIFDMSNADPTPYYPQPRVFDEAEALMTTDNRPGAIIETEQQLQIKDQIMAEMEQQGDDDGRTTTTASSSSTSTSSKRQYPQWLYTDYGELIEMEQAEYDIDDPNAIDSSTLGSWTIFDLESQFEYEWHPNRAKDDEPDPNKAALAEPDTRYLTETPKDEDGVEVGFTATFGPSNPIDERTILGTKDSYMIDERYRDDSLLTPQFDEADVEGAYNHDVVQFRKSLDLLETYVDPFLPADLPIPRHVAKWHGYPEPMYFEAQNFTNNRFTQPHDRTDFDALSPYRARVKAVELARAKNAEWLPDGVSQAWHAAQRAPYNAVGTLMGTLRAGHVDESLRQQIQPVLQVLGNCVELLSTHVIISNHNNHKDDAKKDDGDGDDDKENNNDQEESIIFRFAYHGLMKNKYGMKCWTEEMIVDCGVNNLSNVVFETGFRRRDAAYDGGDAYYGPRHY